MQHLKLPPCNIDSIVIPNAGDIMRHDNKSPAYHMREFFVNHPQDGVTPPEGISEVMNKAIQMKDHEIRRQVLQHLYDIRRENPYGCQTGVVADILKLNLEIVESAVSQLAELGLAKYERIGGGGGFVEITTPGRDEIEDVGGLPGVMSVPVNVHNDNSTTTNNVSTSTNQGNSNILVGDGTLTNNQSTNTTVAEIIAQINSTDTTPEQKQEAKSILAELTNNPLICAAVGGVVSGLTATATTAF